MDNKEFHLSRRILIAGVGNELRQDDAFGMKVAKSLGSIVLPEGVKVQEVGIGGIHLVQELHNAYDILIIVDAVKWGGKPGNLSFRLAETEDITLLSKDERNNFLADMHYTNPVRALMLAKALKVLPPKVYILGCEARDTDDFKIGMSEEVNAAVHLAMKKLLELVQNQSHEMFRI